MSSFTFFLIQLYVFLLPFESAWDLLLGEDSIWKPYRIVGVLMLLIGLGQLLGGRLRLDRYDWRYLFIFVWGLVLALAWDALGEANLEYTWEILPLAVFGWATHIVIKNQDLTLARIDRLLNVFLFANGLSILVSELDPEVRFTGLYKNPNQLGFSAGVCLVYLLGKAFFDRRRIGWPKRLLLGAFAVANVAILALSGSRGSTAGVGMALIASIYLLNATGELGRGLTRVMLVLSAGLLVLMFWSQGAVEEVTSSPVVTRYSFERAKGLSGRLDIWRSALLVAVDHYGIGVGMSQYRYHHRDYIKLVDVIEERSLMEGRGTHSDLIDLTVNYGLLGLFLYVGMVVRLFRSLFRAAREHAATSFLFPTAAIIYCVVLGAELSGDMLINPLYYFVIAIVVSVTRLANPAEARVSRASQQPARTSIGPLVPRPKPV